jgi:protein SCO1/2
VEEIAARVDRIRLAPARRDELVELLPEGLPLYAGHSTNETKRIRGYVLAAFEQTGLPDTALPYVLEELESGREPYLVAAAACAVRGLPRPTGRVIPFLLRAIENMHLRDDTVTFEGYRPPWPWTRPTTALSEIFKTLGWLGASAAAAVPRLEAMHNDPPGELSPAIHDEIGRALEAIRSGAPAAGADCCSVWPSASDAVTLDHPRCATADLPSDVTFEDQDGDRLTFADCFCGKPSVVAFFYTRCDNPNKCSLTITKLAELQQRLRERGVSRKIRTMAITYDPEYDSPPLLKSYGLNRGVTFSSDHRILRSRSGFDELRQYFRLGVNYGPATVNRHRIELFVLDASGRITAMFARLRWDVAVVADEVMERVSAEPRRS